MRKTAYTISLLLLANSASASEFGATIYRDDRPTKTLSKAEIECLKDQKEQFAHMLMAPGTRKQLQAMSVDRVIYNILIDREADEDTVSSGFDWGPKNYLAIRFVYNSKAADPRDRCKTLGGGQLMQSVREEYRERHSPKEQEERVSGEGSPSVAGE